MFLSVPIFDAVDLSLKVKSGSACLFPTDTLPALGALPEYAAQLWNLKRIIERLLSQAIMGLP